MFTGAEQNNELVHVKVTTCFMARLDMYRWLFLAMLLEYSGPAWHDCPQ
jgi:hypothetical protein